MHLHSTVWLSLKRIYKSSPAHCHLFAKSHMPSNLGVNHSFALLSVSTCLALNILKTRSGSSPSHMSSHLLSAKSCSPCFPLLLLFIPVSSSEGEASASASAMGRACSVQSIRESIRRLKCLIDLSIPSTMTRAKEGWKMQIPERRLALAVSRTLNLCRPFVRYLILFKKKKSVKL